jgi:O-antigen/teichoic acid export membrane protein
MPEAMTQDRAGRAEERKLSVDIAFTVGSFAILAASGLAINMVITAIRDPESLGVFNRAYAAYVVASQVAVWGIHYSVLRHAAFHRDDAAERGAMLNTAAAASLVLGIASAAALWLAAPALQGASSQASVEAMRYASLGLALFPLNKVLLAYLNGLRGMKTFSALQSLRYVMIMAGVCAVALSDRPIAEAMLAFPATEAALAALTLAILSARGLLGGVRPSARWLGNHLRFGTKALVSGMFAELNSRLDVLLIGFFLDDRSTGIYSFVAMLADGLYHMLAMVRINFNPMLVSIVRDGAWEHAARLRRYSLRWVVPGVAIGSLLVAAGAFVLDRWIMPGKGIAEGMPSLGILLLALNLVAALVPLDNLLLVSGHPGFQTLQQLAALASNLVVTLALLPHVGIAGAALGTAAYYLVGMAMLVLLARRVLGWNLLAGTHRAP